ncbi:MAG: hypothetical protein P1V97_19240 [Planctomycetota bacterium]|nr:hypothetical protein [Planctomycetota bacterium]
MNSKKLIAFTSILVLAMSPPVLAQGKKIPRTKHPSTKVPSKRTGTPRKPEIKPRDRLAARDLFTYLRFNRFDKAEQLIVKLKRQGRLEDVRLAYFELWPSPKVLSQIAKRIQSQNPARRKLLEPWAALPRSSKGKKEKEPQRTPQKGKLF